MVTAVQFITAFKISPTRNHINIAELHLSNSKNEYEPTTHNIAQQRSYLNWNNYGLHKYMDYT